MYGELHSLLVNDEYDKEHQTRWSCLFYGSYPANEVVSVAFDAVDAYAVEEGDLIIDAVLYSKLSEADWDGNEDTVIDGKRYHRLCGADAVTASGDRSQHYRWRDLSSWHYFAYAPIKWRILNIKGTETLLLADRMPDNCPFHDGPEDVSWSESHLRQVPGQLVVAQGQFPRLLILVPADQRLYPGECRLRGRKRGNLQSRHGQHLQRCRGPSRLDSRPEPAPFTVTPPVGSNDILSITSADL